MKTEAVLVDVSTSVHDGSALVLPDGCRTNALLGDW
jgi:hypothetical protein